MTIPDLSTSFEDYASHEAYAHAMATLALAALDQPDGDFGIGGDSDHLAYSTFFAFDSEEDEYAIEPSPGDCARGHDTELAGLIDELPIYAAGARLIKRTVLYGPWRYVTPEEVQGL